jgi:hypothetical protein
MTSQILDHSVETDTTPSIQTYAKGLTIWGSIPSKSKRFFISPKCPEWLQDMNE